MRHEDTPAQNLADLANLAAIGMGSNLGNREATLLAAWHDLGLQPRIQPLQLSSPYLSAPLDMESDHGFINAVGLIQTSLQALDLLHTLQQLEKRYGRRRDSTASGYQDRTLDLDLLFFADLCLQTEELTLPHPRLHKRLFVLAPLAELLPSWRHPLLGGTAATWADKIARQGEQQVQRQQWQLCARDA